MYGSGGFFKYGKQKKNIPNVKFPVFIIFKCTVLFRIYENVYIHTI